MSAKFCLFIPAKVLQIDKHFSKKLQLWVADPQNIRDSDLGLSNYSLYSLSEFQKRQDVYLDLPDHICDRYHVIDWGFYWMPSPLLMAFLAWLAKIYVYGEVGVLRYWSDGLRRFPPIKMGKTGASLSDLSVNLSINDLPLDTILFFPLKQVNTTD